MRVFVGTFALAAAAALAGPGGTELSGEAGAPRVPVLVELFTSEGCSSCPAADALLAHLESTQPVAGAEVIALKQHVDYWNHLGWADPFSSPAFTRRQNDYAERFGNGSVYTPQMIVDGEVEFVGSFDRQARDAVAKAASNPKAHIELRRTPATPALVARAVLLRVSVTALPPLSPGDRADLLLAVTESNLSSRVTRGENAGLTLAHSAVARDLRVVAELPGGLDFSTDLVVPVSDGWKLETLRVVVFVQERRSRRVLGAAARRLAEE